MIGNNVEINMSPKEQKLKQACAQGNINTVKHLMEMGVNIHIQNEICLSIASIKGNLAMTKFLIKKGICPHIDEDLALRFADNYGNQKIV